MAFDSNKQITMLLFISWFLFVPWPWHGSTLLALTTEDLDPALTYFVKEIVISGNASFSDQELLGQISIKQRPWYEFWKSRPIFDADGFQTDIKRLKRFYEAHGYYRATVGYDLRVEDSLVTARINVTEDRPVKVASVEVEVQGPGPKPAELHPSAQLPLQEGQTFEEGAYQQSEQILRNIYLESGYAHVQVQRSAEVDVTPNESRAIYSVRPGPKAVFGDTRLEGVKKVDPKLVLRELTYHAGEQFSPEKIKSSHDNIVKLELFAVVQFIPTLSDADPNVVPIVIRVREKPRHEVRLDLGYNTETLFNARLEWRDYNWLGGGRRLSLLTAYSDVTSSLAAILVQPYLFSRESRGAVEVRVDQQTYQTYTLNASRFGPRIEYQFSRTLSGFAGYRLEHQKFNGVSAATVQALGGLRREGFLSGPSFGLILDRTDNPFEPKQGEVVSLYANQAGEIWGGDYRYYRITAEARKYYLLGWETVFASRFKLGIADSFGAHKNIPLSERFYSGGEGSVRGYGLRRIGPLSASDDPLGGLSLVEGSVELRRPIWGPVEGSLFFDVGQVSTHAYKLPFDSLQLGIGPALSFTTPVGPVRFDLGFPFKTPRGDSNWQLYFSIGQFY